jgi:hypothetical protein
VGVAFESFHRQACERSLGEILGEALVGGPRRVNPKGASGGRHAKHMSVRKGLLGGLKPRNRGRAGRPIASAVGSACG